MIDYIGAAVCHNIPERTLKLGGEYLPVCARCAGIYMGIFSTFIYLFIRKRLAGSKPPGLFFVCASVFGMTALMIDGLSSYMGLRESGNLLRLITGISAGSVLPVFFLLAHNFDAQKTGSAIIKKTREYFIILLIPLTIGVFNYNDAFLPRIAVSIFICAGIFAAPVFLSLMIMKILFRGLKIKTRMIFSVLFSVFAIVVSNFIQAIIS